MKWDNLVVGPHRVTVSTREWSDGTVGEAEYVTGSIRIERRLKQSRVVETMFHEITHLLLWGLPLSDEHDELVADAMGKGLASFVKDNPTWVRRFLKIFKEEDEKCQMK